MLNNREKLIELLKKNLFDDYDFEDLAEELIANGVKVQKKGEWEWEYIVTHGVAEKKTVCSLCGAPNKQYRPPYCPHCGAKMDGDRE